MIDSLSKTGYEIPPLPTELISAKAGIQSFRNLMAEIGGSDKFLFQRIETNLSYSSLIGLFIGIFPESSLEGFSKEDQESLISHLNQTHDSNIVAVTNDVDPRISRYHPYSFINLKAASKVAEPNPDLFDRRAVTDTKAWFEENKPLWLNVIEDKDSKRRYGLLSGFPRSAVENFITYSQGRSIILNSLSSSQEEKDFLEKNVLFTTEDIPPEIKDDVKSTLTKIPDITEEQINLILNRRGVNQLGPNAFFGFSEADEKWGFATRQLCRQVLNREELSFCELTAPLND